MRTADWVCQWCGYPLFSRSFKTIEKTYKEIQEERLSALRTEPTTEPALEPAFAPEPAPEPEQKLEPEPVPAPEHTPEPEQKPVPELPSEPETAPEPGPALAPEPAPEPEQKLEPEPPLEPKTAPEPRPAPKPEQKLKPEPVPTPEPAPEPEPAVKPDPTPVPAPAPALPVKREGSISVDELNDMYKADKQAAHNANKGKTLTVTGVLDKIFVREHLEIRYIVLGGTGNSNTWSVRASFKKENASGLTRLPEKQPVTVRGTYDGYGRNILLKDCVLLD
jgi:hypothetical protein